MNWRLVGSGVSALPWLKPAAAPLPVPEACVEAAAVPVAEAEEALRDPAAEEAGPAGFGAAAAAFEANCDEREAIALRGVGIIVCISNVSVLDE
jgi:hypothetical protein